MAAFATHEALDCVTTRAGSRSYVFVVFRFVAEPRAALEALRGSKVKSAFIWVEYTWKGQKQATSTVEDHSHLVKRELACKGFCWSTNERGKNSYQCSPGGLTQYT
ncbi:uncharacterized protein [Aegilops tauschii subsp. strangulata]|uniref:uncharacterized protein n=1 Tax=Aegilops tauschii subsp. strangulata TaxID=200361 RepID=UPI001ABD345D|nr:uncharacterized protein LOC120965228 [Aegilops tauschii subsp. strangulata]